MISVIIPTLNEENALPHTLAHLAKQPGAFEIIVVDGGSSDRTVAIATAHGVQQIVHAKKGRAAQMNEGAKLAKGEILLFLHADTHLPKRAIAKIATLLENPSVQAGGFRHRFSGRHKGLRLVSRLHNVRCRITGIFYGDQAPFIRKDLFVTMGGYPNQPILEDLLFGEQLRRITQPTLLDDYVVTDSRKFEKQGIARSFLRVLSILICHELRLPILAKKFFAPIR